MRYQIVSDSSSNIFHVEGVNYTTVPMKIIAGDREYIDAPGMDVRGMVDDLKAYKGKSGSSCANAQEWLDAFGDADMVFGVTISRNLSGSFNAAEAAAREYAEEQPDKKIHIFDTLSAGPEQAMVVEKIARLVSWPFHPGALIYWPRTQVAIFLRISARPLYAEPLSAPASITLASSCSVLSR